MFIFLLSFFVINICVCIFNFQLFSLFSARSAFHDWKWKICESVCVKANANQTNYKNIFIFCLSWRLCRGKTSMFSAKKNLNFLFLFFNLKFPSSEGEPSRRPKRKIELHKIIILICAWDESLRWCPCQVLIFRLPASAGDSANLWVVLCNFKSSGRAFEWRNGRQVASDGNEESTDQNSKENEKLLLSTFACFSLFLLMGCVDEERRNG